MGCDIHLHTEVKINGKWHHYGCPSVSRSYLVFSKMANVRNNHGVDPIAEPRGIPSDATELTKFDCERWGCDGHSHSWLSAEEIAALYDYINEDLELYGCRFKHLKWWPEENFGYFFGNTWGGFWKYRNDPGSGTPDGVEDVRFVFWFDN